MGEVQVSQQWVIRCGGGVLKLELLNGQGLKPQVQYGEWLTSSKNNGKKHLWDPQVW